MCDWDVSRGNWYAGGGWFRPMFGLGGSVGLQCMTLPRCTGWTSYQERHDREIERESGRTAYNASVK